ncbi:MAG: peptidoglycan editing factor PgeF [Nitrospirae bacterium]|nr:MAG: peptidoglycan editing factor PgeF [Nitrospirota bacterium]
MERLLRPDIFPADVTAFFTGRDPGADLSEIGRMLRLDAGHIYLPVQKHTDRVVIIDAETDPRIADAVVTSRKGLLIGIQVADCVPVLLFDRRRQVSAAVHAGWRGTAEAIMKKTLRAMSDRFGSEAEDIVAAVGPSIKGCCYEVGPEVVRAVERTTGTGDYVRQKGGKYVIDLAAANRYQALSAGIKEENIWMSGDCTFCNPDRYCSYRFAKGTTCRQAGFIGML